MEKKRGIAWAAAAAELSLVTIIPLGVKITPKLKRKIMLERRAAEMRAARVLEGRRGRLPGEMQERMERIAEQL